jgi:hypothetical protein
MRHSGVARLSRPQLPYQDGLQESELCALELFHECFLVARLFGLSQSLHGSGPDRGRFENLRFFWCHSESPLLMHPRKHPARIGHINSRS